MTGLDLHPLAQPDAQTGSAGDSTAAAYVLRESSLVLPRCMHTELLDFFGG